MVVVRIVMLEASLPWWHVGRPSEDNVAAAEYCEGSRFQCRKFVGRIVVAK